MGRNAVVRLLYGGAFVASHAERTLGARVFDWRGGFQCDYEFSGSQMCASDLVSKAVARGIDHACGRVRLFHLSQGPWQCFHLLRLLMRAGCRPENPSRALR